jgi:hypothetical protein
MSRHILPIETRINRLRAELDVIMLQHSAIEPRGFDTRNQREELHREWDQKYDELAWLRIQAVLERDTEPPAAV